MDIEDSWTAFQLDAALALKGWKQEQEINKYFISLIDWHILQVCRALGAKGIPKTPPKLEIETPENPEELPSLEEVIAKLGGVGTVLKVEKKGE